MANVTFFRQKIRFQEKKRFFAMMKHLKLHLLILICVLPFLQGCKEHPENPNRPLLLYPITIYPNTMQYQELNVVGGYVYLTPEAESTSRGLIVYRESETEFLAYDRMPPNYPDACTDNQGNTKRLIVDFPFVVDKCNNAYYNILNGEIIVVEPDKIPSFPVEGEVIYPLIQYHTLFDGSKLTISN